MGTEQAEPERWTPSNNTRNIVLKMLEKFLNMRSNSWESKKKAVMEPAERYIKCSKHKMVKKWHYPERMPMQSKVNDTGFSGCKTHTTGSTSLVFISLPLIFPPHKKKSLWDPKPMPFKFLSVCHSELVQFSQVNSQNNFYEKPYSCCIKV